MVNEMQTRIITLSPSCEIVETSHLTTVKEVELRFIEHSADYWSSDTETSIDISKEKAQEIISFLCESFDIKL